MKSKFNEFYVSDLIKSPYGIALGVLFALAYAFIISKKGILGAAAFPPLIFMGFYMVFFFRDPRLGLYSTIFLAFIGIGLTRYAPGLPLGLAIDGVLFLVYIAYFFRIEDRPEWKMAHSGLVYACYIWMAYAFFELVNPEARSRVAWFYAMRGVHLYMIMIIPLVLSTWNKRKYLTHFIYLWFILSLLGTFKGIIQNTIGVDYAEKAWLDAGAATQHILFGKLRVFSFYTDAGQFGASQAHTGVVALAASLSPKNSFKQRIFFIFTALMSFYGMMISGTRGAMAVPALGILTFLLLSKRITILMLGLMMMFGAYAFLKYTTILQNVYAVRRMRSGLDPNEPSLMVRHENQKKLAVYLKNRPFGGGIGSAGSWGLRFSPNTVLAQTPTDSWFVRIWAEEGIVGLYIHLAVLFYVAIQGGVYIWHMKDEHTRFLLMGLHSGMMGIYAASYGNGVLGQMPTGVLLYISMAFIFLAKHLDKEIEEEKKSLT